MARDNYALITNRIISALESGTVPWRSPWSVIEHGPLRNGATGYVYRGINVVLLSLTSHAAGFTDPRWLTFKQALDRGGHVRKGEKGTPVVFWKWIEREEEEDGEVRTRRFPVLRTYTVFNAQQCDGVDLSTLPEPESHEHRPIEAAQAIVAGFAGGPKLAHDGGNRAYYRPAPDSVHLPALKRFESPEAYYSVTFHELVHSTGHSSRLDRPSVAAVAPFGSPNYSQEELVAEFGAAFLCGEAGIVDQQLEQSAAYIAHWLKVLRADKRLALVAAGQAQRAANLILGQSLAEEGI